MFGQCTHTSFALLTGVAGIAGVAGLGIGADAAFDEGEEFDFKEGGGNRECGKGASTCVQDLRIKLASTLKSIGEEHCRHIGGQFVYQQQFVYHI